MSLFGYAPEDIETALVAYLGACLDCQHPASWHKPVCTCGCVKARVWRCGFERKTTDPLPFRLITQITGTESVGENTADVVVSIHTLCDKAQGATAARDEAKLTHRRMLKLITEPAIIIGTRTIAVQYLEVVEQPTWQYYAENVLRKVGRYRIGLPYLAA